MQMSINSLSVRYVNSFCCLSSPIHTKSFKESVNSSLFLKQKKKYAHTKTKNPQSIKNKGVFGLELLRMSSHIYTHKRGESLFEKKKKQRRKGRKPLRPISLFVLWLLNNPENCQVIYGSLLSSPSRLV